MYKIDRSFGIGELSEDGWWNFDRIDIFRSLDDSFIFKNQAEVTITSYPLDSEFRFSQPIDSFVNLTATITKESGKIKVMGSTT